jgi:tetratricopeptide (TPR) repeat protein
MSSCTDLWNQGKDLEDAKQYEKAIDLYKKAIALEPHHEGLYHRIGVCYIELEKYQGAVEWLEKSIPVKKSTWAYHRIAESYRSLKKYKEAVDTCMKCYEFEPSSTHNLCLLYGSLDDAGKTLEAIEWAKKAVETSPTGEWSYHKIAEMYLKLKKYNEAAEWLIKSTEVKPSNIWPYHQLVVLYRETKKVDECVKWCERSIEVSSQGTWAYFQAAEALTENMKREQAIAWHKRAFEVDPTSIYACHQAGVLCEELMKRQDAIEWYKKALDLKATEWTYDKIVTNLLDLKKKDEAIEYLKLKAAAFPSDDNCNKLGDLLCDLGREEDAIKWYEKSKDSYGKSRFQILQRVVSLKNLSQSTEKILETLNKAGPENSASVKEAEIKLKKFSETKNTIIKKLFAAGGKGSSDEDNKKLEQMAKDIEDLKRTLISGGVYEKAYVKEGFQDLEKQNIELLNYAKIFYWTLLNYFGAYRNLSTGLVGGDMNKLISEKHTLIEEGAKKAIKFGVEVSRGMPFIGGLIGALDRIIDSVCSHIREKVYENKINSINQVIMLNSDPNAILEDELSLKVAKTAIAVTLAKKEEILDQLKATPGVIVGKYEAYRKKIDSIVQLDLKGVDTYKTEMGKLALGDVGALIAYMWDHSTDIIHAKDPLDVQMKQIVVNGGLDSLMTLPTSNGDIPIKKSACCNIF